MSRDPDPRPQTQTQTQTMYRKQVRRRRAVLIGLVALGFVLLTITFGSGAGGFGSGAGSVFGPFEKVAGGALKPARDLVNWFDETLAARGDRERLEGQLEDARALAVAGQAAMQENEQLRKLVKLRSRGRITDNYTPVTGSVISRSPTVWYSTVGIDKGGSNGVRMDDPVINGDGLVGRVSSVSRGTSVVTLITDSSSEGAVTAKVLPGGAQGVIRPKIGASGELVLEFLDETRNIGRGQAVVTSGWRGDGLSSLYPPNLPIGEVAARIVAVLFLAILIQNAFFSMVEVFGASIWILPALATIFGLLGGSMVGATVGFTIGFFADGLTDGPLGTACLVFMAIGYGTGLYRERGDQPPTMAAALIAGAATFVASVALGLFTILLGFDGYLSAAALPDLLLQGIYGLLLAAPLFILTRRILRPALVEERTSRHRTPTVSGS